MITITDLENKTAEEILVWVNKTFDGKFALASSFGAEDVVLTDMLLKINPNFKIFTLDTGRLPAETYEVWERIEDKYGIKIKAYFPESKSVEEMINKHGPNLFYRSVDLRKLCCHVRKIEPLNRALKDLEAWVCGLRKEQSITRQDIKKVEIDDMHNGIIKVNPLADWTEKQVWDYIRENDIPYNKLHDQNYPSIGCAPCTRAIKPGEDVRAGRWWWELPESKECGLHSRKK